MKIIYELAIRFLGLYFLIGSIFNKKAKAWVTGRKNWVHKLNNCPKNSIWFHCASLGEFDQALPVMRAIKRANPTEIISVSFFSPSGMDHFRKRDHSVDYAFYLPLDTKKNAQEFIRILNPRIAIFIKYEFWPNYIDSCHNEKVPFISMDALFRESQFFFRWYGYYFFKSLKKVDYFLVQNEGSKNVLNSKGIENVSVTGDTRYENVLQRKAFMKENQILLKFSKDEFVIIVGSSWKKEEEIISEYLRSNKTCKVILAPHDTNESNILRLVQLLKIPSIRYTKFDQFSDERILIIDTIGHLTDAYKYADIAFIGGGFSGKLHNILEPAVYGLPILFGPNYAKFPEAEHLINHDVAFPIKNKNDFEKIIQELEQRKINKEKIINVIESHSDTSEKIINCLNANNFL
jgi:3-deoxy-D-manno-octulosonic-acid transferase